VIFPNLVNNTANGYPVALKRRAVHEEPNWAGDEHTSSALAF
jgi:hypothetical protein